MRKGYITAIGYLLFLLGFLSILFSIVGLELTMMSWLSSFGSGASIVIRLSFLFMGLIIMYVSKLPPEEDDVTFD